MKFREFGELSRAIGKIQFMRYMRKLRALFLSSVKEDLGGFTKVEQEILDGICEKNNVPKLLVSKLLNAEFDSQGMTKHSKIYPKLGKILSEEWRTWDEIETIKEELKDKRKRKSYKTNRSREKLNNASDKSNFKKLWRLPRQS